MSEESRETLEMDVVFVGAGPASLAGAYRLAELIEQHNARDGAEPIEIEIAVLEKGKELGSHALSGAVVDPVAFQELFPDDWEDAPFEAPVGPDRVLWLSESKAHTVPTPPPLSNHGYFVASLGKLVKWLGEKAEEKGVSVFPEFPASQVLVEDGAVVGVRTKDQGVDKEGEKKANFQPGMDIRTRCTVLGEGVRGTLVKQLDERLDLWAGKNPMTYSIGIKEHWELPEGRITPGSVTHTMSWPLGKDLFGGGFIYGMEGNVAAVGLVVGLDYENPWTDPHALFQRMKTHPEIAKLLEGGKMINYGAKAIPEGGWYAMPKLYGDGFLIVGDSGGFLNSQKLKGISLGMKSGMLAAETIFECLKTDRFAEADLARLQGEGGRELAQEGPVEGAQLPPGVRQGAPRRGRPGGARVRHRRPRLGLQEPAGDRGRPRADGAPRPPSAAEAAGRWSPTATLTFDRLADVYNSGTSHEEDQPVHLQVADPSICVERCTVEYGNPCERFCPAAVYEVVDDAEAAAGRRLQINASNCVHCKTCDIMDPYQIITWVPPEGGGGPSYGRM